MGKPTVTEAIQAIKEARGFVTKAASLCNTSRTTYHAMMNEHPTLMEAVTTEREKLKDFAEGKLLQQIDGGNVTAIIFYLKTQGKDRGYVERQEITGRDGGPMEISGLDAALTKIYGDDNSD